MKATGEDGKDGVDGKDGIDGKDGKDGKDATTTVATVSGTNGKDGADGKNGTNGKDGVDGKDGVNGKDGQDGATPTIGENGNWYINGTDTGIYAGDSQAEKVNLTFKELGKDYTIQVPVGSTVKYYVPENAVATFVNWYADEACTQAYNFNDPITEDTVIYSKWEFDETFKLVGELTEAVNFGKASCFGTSACFGSVYVRVLADGHGYYSGAAGIANYLKNVFVEDESGNVSVNMQSGLGRISYTSALTIINFASAYSSYQEYIIRNNLEMAEDIAAQKELAIKYFKNVDYTADGYHTKTGGGGLSFPSMAIAVVAMGNLFEQQNTERYDTLIKNAYENVDTAFYNSGMYLQPFYQLCAKYDWFTALPQIDTTTALTDANVLTYYGYGINLEKEYPELWDAYVENALSDGKLTSSEAKAFAYHYAYQLTDGDVYLGVYGNSRNIVDYSIAK